VFFRVKTETIYILSSKNARQLGEILRLPNTLGMLRTPLSTQGAYTGISMQQASQPSSLFLHSSSTFHASSRMSHELIGHTITQEGLAVASIARDDPSPLPGITATVTMRPHALRLAAAWPRSWDWSIHVYSLPTSRCPVSMEEEGLWLCALLTYCHTDTDRHSHTYATDHQIHARAAESVSGGSISYTVNHSTNGQFTPRDVCRVVRGAGVGCELFTWNRIMYYKQLTSYRGSSIRCTVDVRRTCKVRYMWPTRALESPCCYMQ